MKGLVMLALVVGCAACGENNDVTGPTADAVPISGRVIKFFSRETIGSASVEFRPAAGSTAIATATDAAGRYSLTLPRGGEYLVFVSGNAKGIAYVGGGGYLGDLIIDDGRCVARYGTVTDVAGRPLANAAVSLQALKTVSAGDGWYSIEFGCPSTGMIGGNTLLMQVNRPGYSSWSRVVDHTITGVQRLDVALQKLD